MQRVAICRKELQCLVEGVKMLAGMCIAVRFSVILRCLEYITAYA